MNTTNTYTVDGMTCGHCVKTVKKEVGQVAGVSSVDVDPKSGAVIVTSTGELDDAAIRSAVEEAGYEVRR